jgi:hypothetical protein
MDARSHVDRPERDDDVGAGRGASLGAIAEQPDGRQLEPRAEPAERRARLAQVGGGPPGDSVLQAPTSTRLEPANPGRYCPSSARPSSRRSFAPSPCHDDPCMQARVVGSSRASFSISVGALRVCE